MYKKIFIILLLAPALYAFWNPAKKLNQKALNLFSQGEYSESEKYFSKALEKAPENPEILYNLANAQYAAGQYASASSNYHQSLIHSGDKQLREKTFFNQGNNAFRMKEYQQAVESYQEALRLEPENENYKQNLELAQKFLREYSKQQQQQQQSEQREEKSGKKDDKESKQQNGKNDQKEDAQGEQNPSHDQAKQSETEENSEGEEGEKQKNTANSVQLSEEQTEELLKSIQEYQQNLERPENQQENYSGDSSGKSW